MNFNNLFICLIRTYINIIRFPINSLLQLSFLSVTDTLYQFQGFVMMVYECLFHRYEDHPEEMLLTGDSKNTEDVKKDEDSKKED